MVWRRGGGESEIVITSWLLVPLLEDTTLGLRGGGGRAAYQLQEILSGEVE